MPPRRAPSVASVTASRPASPAGVDEEASAVGFIPVILIFSKVVFFDTVDELQQHVYYSIPLTNLNWYAS